MTYLSAAKDRVVDCIDDIRKWMLENRLLLNPSKTKFIWFAAPSRLHLIDRSPFQFAGEAIEPVDNIRLLGVTLDTSLSFADHIAGLTKSCMHKLRTIREVRKTLSISATLLCVLATVVSAVDYYNSLVYDVPDYLISKIQTILNVAARLINRQDRRASITPLMRDRLHWL